MKHECTIWCWIQKVWVILAFLIAAHICHAQSAPNCNLTNQILGASGTGSNYNATQLKCVAWTFSYFSEGFSAVSIQVEQAPDNAGAPGAFAIVPAANIIGTNPLTSTTRGSFTINGYFPWVRVNLTTATGTGFVNYSLIGNSYVGPSSNVATSSTISGTVPVDGPDANGSPSTTPPVQVAGNDGTNVRRVAVTTGGSVGIGNVVTAPDAVPNTQIAGTGTAAALDLLGEAQFLFDGTNWDRVRSMGITNATVPIPPGVTMAEKSGRASVVSNPAAGGQATASTAGVAGQRRIPDCISFSAAANVAPAATLLTVNLRDGASGAGTIIWTYQVEIVAAIGQDVVPHTICGLNLTNTTTGNALTLEFSAGLANLLESVSLSYFVIQ